MIREHLGFGAEAPELPVPLSAITLPEPRLSPPASLVPICSSEPYERALHAYGRSYMDILRAFRGRFEHAPDVVIHPRDEAELETALEWAISAGAAVIPFGGGTSVVGGVEPRVGDDFAGAVTIDLKALDRVLEVDPVSRAARIQAGAIGPRLEEQLGRARIHAAPLSRSPFSSPPSAAGSPPAPGATSRRYTPTSTTSSSPSGPSRRRACGNRDGFRGRAPGCRPTGS